MLITLAQRKGGAGKSTVALTLAGAFMEQGRKVLLVDADPQETLIATSEQAQAGGWKEGPPTIAMGDNLRTQLPGVAEGYDVVIIDTPGRLGKRTMAAFMISDLALFPCKASAADLWALQEALDMADEVSGINEDLKIGLVLNMASRTSLAASAREALAETGRAVLPAELGDRVAFAEAMAAGLPVTTYSPGSVASLEARKLVEAVEYFAGGNVHV